ncbi:DUF456 domain-containing protein [Myroides sp. DF42-4-2]|uniref:DUF456 domain-containing protein n=1 Tax=unclassified Myroides TaxID=2642485 RepID=UPI00257693F5|nr:DUF456 domain-containing protein [Myroides sp. DF42-4-2]MDM1406300.1 DUF456 domain-containing protein [Myroides sp. DF42-4-2]
MDYFLLILGFLLLIGGIIGSVLPALPGPPVSWLGILCLSFVEGMEISSLALWGSLVVTVVISVLDYVIPAQGTKRFGGSTYGVWGTNIGLVLGLITPIPLGFIIGPFLGALIGELLYDSRDISRALKAAIGSFIGFLASTFLKVVFGLVLLVWGIVLLVQKFSAAVLL